MHAFKKGDVVHLKSGGPNMTCSQITKVKNRRVECMWFAGDKLMKNSFPYETLELEEKINGKKKYDEKELAELRELSKLRLLSSDQKPI
jgi:uncharacterized protein YodC (DUF2158 family)